MYSKLKKLIGSHAYIARYFIFKSYLMKKDHIYNYKIRGANP